MGLTRNAAVAALLCVACAHPPPLRRATLEVARQGEVFRPYVRVLVAGRPLRLLVDTGASGNVLPVAIADALHLRRGGSGQSTVVVDASGARRTLRVLPGVPVQFEGEAAGSLDFLGNPANYPGGILSPSELATGGAALVMDFPGAELRLEPQEDALRRLGDRAHKLQTSTCLNEGLVRRPLRYAEVPVNGAAVRLLLDTGADATRLEGDSVALASLEGREAHALDFRGVTSKTTDLVVDDVLVEFAGRRFSVPLAVSYRGATCRAGILGMDVLRHCVLVWGAKDVWAAC